MDTYPEYANTAQGVAGVISRGPYGNEASPPRQPVMDETLSRMSHIADIMSGAFSDLSSVQDRLFGPQPNLQAAGNSAREKPMGRVDEVSAFLDALTGRANEIAAIARGLNGRL